MDMLSLRNIGRNNHGLVIYSKIIVIVQHVISFTGIMIILSGVSLAAYQYLYSIFVGKVVSDGAEINAIRLSLGRILILGLEFIVAADLISTTTAPDYYTIGIVAIVVAIRTLLSFSLNREIMGLSKQS
ncbi:MAG: DUF1622 domain-containing protein [Coxiellaceae bacterium]|nr:MAG: DUF1622 domain-containing protein [Coxiellaceae bacterium]